MDGLYDMENDLWDSDFDPVSEPIQILCACFTYAFADSGVSK